MAAIRIGMISYWHVHAWDYTKEALAHPDTEITAVWDENTERGQEQAEKLGVPYYASLTEMLDSGIEAVIVDAPTRLHRDVMVQAARAGKHIFTEKVLAPNLQEVQEILDAVQQNNVKLAVSLPRLNDGYTLAISEALQEGLLGRVTQVRVRLSHNGAIAGWLPEHFYDPVDCGGGALIDLGCHPVYLTRLFLGEDPVEVTAQFGYVMDKRVEDNAVMTLSTASGTVGIAEAGFVNPYSPFTIEVHGTEGSLLYGTPESRLLLRTGAKGEEYAGQWHELEIPANRAGAFAQWIRHIQDGTSAEGNIRAAVELTRLMEAAYRSVQEKRSVVL
jgi:predicted dehydrogenase